MLFNYHLVKIKYKLGWIPTHCCIFVFVYHSTTTTKPRRRLRCLVGVGKTTHTRHHAEHVVVNSVDADLGSATRAHSVDGHSELEGRLVDTGEVAGTAGLVLLRLECEGVDVDTAGRSAGVVLEGLHAVEVATLTLRETILTVELELGDLHGVLTLALHTRVEHNLGQQVVGGILEDLGTGVGDGVQPRGTCERGTRLDTKTREVRTVGTIRCGGDLEGRSTATERTAGEHVHHDTLRGEVIGVVEGLATVDLRNEVLAGGAVHERVTLNNPHELLDGVVEVELDLVGRRGDRLSTRVLELLDEVLVGLLGEPAALLSVEVHVVNVQRRSSQGLDGGGGGSRTRLLVVAAVDPLLELHVDAHLVVLEGDQGDRKTGVAAEPELEGDVEGLGRGACTGSARVGELGSGARGIEGITTSILHQDEVVGVTDHIIESLDGTSILGELGPDLHPVTVLPVDALTTDLELHNLDEPVADVVEPAEAAEVGRTDRGEVHCGENHLHVGAVHQVGIAVDDGSHTLVEVSLSVEGDLDGLHREVGVALVQHLPESDLRVARDINILCTV
jgi:hypothetical protein